MCPLLKRTRTVYPLGVLVNDSLAVAQGREPGTQRTPASEMKDITLDAHPGDCLRHSSSAAAADHVRRA